MDVIVRQAKSADAPGLALLRWRWSVDERGEEPAVPKESYVEHYVAWLGERSGTHLPYVAEATAGLVGMAWLVVGDRPPTPGRLARRGGDIQSVYVIPELRRSGVGERLISTLIEQARRLELAHVTVHSAHTAIGFYQRLGFVHDEQWLALDHLE